MIRYFVELAYDGTHYHGWQIQPNAKTVQETLEKAFSLQLKEKVKFTGAGRTDTGVHASFFVAHFDSVQTDLEKDAELLFRLNRMLPPDIVIRRLWMVPETQHARFSAKSRTYHYVISCKKPLFNRRYCSYYYGKLDMKAMNSASRIIMEYEDFTSFSKLHTDVRTNICCIEFARWVETEEGYRFEIKADRFLRNMVRSVVGTMLDIGAGKMDLEEFREVIESKNRGRAGMSAEAKGLFLVDISY